MQKLLIVSGVTATGKTSVGVRLAKLFGGEILSADSRQVYKGLDCITGKDIEKGQKPTVSGSFIFRDIINDLVTYTIDGIPIWLYDLASVSQSCNVSLYKKAAIAAIDVIRENNTLPIVVGGTGLYISSLTQTIDTLDVPQNNPLRIVLEKEHVRALQKRLEKIDSNKFFSMNHSDVTNPRRLIRAIEVGEWMVNNTNVQQKKRVFDIFFIGLFSDGESQRQRIRERVVERINACAVKEARLLVGKIDEHTPAYSTLGLSLLFHYIHGDVSKEEVIDQWVSAEYAYAKRQETWLKKEKNIVWFDRNTPEYFEVIEKKVREWYTKNTHDNES